MGHILYVIVLLFIAALTLIDIFASDKLRNSADLFHLRAWSKLDDWKQRSISNWLFERRNRKWFAAISIIAAAAFTIFDLYDRRHQELDWRDFSIAGAPILLGALVGWLILILILRASLVGALVRGLVVLAILTLLAPFVGWNAFIYDSDGDWTKYLIWNTAFVAQATAAMFWWAAFLPLLCISFLRSSILVGEYAFRKIGEAKQGALSMWSKLAGFLKGGL